MDKIIEVSGLHNSYGQVHAVRGVDFYVERGKLFALLGPNGAGKSTIIDIICTFLAQDEGTVTVDGNILGKHDDVIRSSIGVVFQDGLLDNLLTVEENLKIRGGFYGLGGEKLRNAIEFATGNTGIIDLLKRRYGKLSGGQRRRCDIARALLNTPKVLFLDEPTTGLDPQTRKNVWETIYSLQRKTGMTVFFTTHYMEEAAEADYIIIIDNGSISAKGTPANLKERYSRDKVVLVCRDLDDVKKILRNMKLEFTQTANRIVIPVASTMASLPIIEKCRSYITGFEVLSGTMDDAFISITGKGIRE